MQKNIWIYFFLAEKSTLFLNSVDLGKKALSFFFSK